MDEQTNVLSLQHVCKNFGGVKAVKDISLDVSHGQRRVLIGTNGAGKTTLFNLIAGDYKVSSGNIQLFGQEITQLPMNKRAKLGLRRTYQTSALFNTLTVAQNLYLAELSMQPTRHTVNLLSHYQKTPEYSHKIKDTAERIALDHKLNTATINLSHGERRQLEFGIATITQPKVLMLDEPSSGLSQKERETMLRLLQSLDRSVTLIMIDHNMEVAFSIADYITVMFDGEMIVEGLPSQIQANETVKEIYLGGKVK